MNSDFDAVGPSLPDDVFACLDMLDRLLKSGVRRKIRGTAWLVMNCFLGQRRLFRDEEGDCLNAESDRESDEQELHHNGRDTNIDAC